MRRTGLVALLLLSLVACSNDDNDKADTTATIVVTAPFSKLPSVAKPIEQGTRLAVERINGAGGIDIQGKKVRLAVRLADDQGSPTTAAANIRKAAADGAVAVVAEGTGVDVAWEDANRAGLPIGIVYQGGEDLVDAPARPNVFRIAPTNRGAAFRLAEYLVPKGMKIALLHDDSPYGAAGGAALDKAFARNRSSVVADLQASAAPGADPAPQVLQARQAGATALLVWAGPQVVASVVRAARSSGWDVPISTGTSGEDPLVRQQLAAHPEWLNGLTFVSSRLTSEKGPGPFTRFREAFEKRFGPQDVGVKSRNHVVIQPPDWAMYPYDFVNVVADAMRRSQSASPSVGLVRAFEETEVAGANGDERGFNRKNHEGVVDDDIFFASFRDMVWYPVRDDMLSASLPPIPQTEE
jgi:ABC-type branched-subunit amino acid transport system substrate-binding protein